ncbi:MAG: hypothetical protein BWX80_03123 [Candidatus Hydrogenedentes bacterium ADurb.Bin101]|nr:MAG: hypothetical protein BWX80_03123 [Candidatus Hydrogenedentes bacterium ADurb.Bin101]
MRIAAGLQDRSGKVNALGQVHDFFLQRGCGRRRFIEGTPADDGRMVIVPIDDFLPLGDNRFLRRFLFVVHTPVRELAPDQIAQFVRPIQETRFEHLLMQPRAVETGGLR